jgi:AraC-like DNA-binding protein
MRRQTRLDHEERIEAAIRYIVEHLDEPIDLRDLADHVCLSRFYFHRLFQALVGDSEAPGAGSSCGGCDWSARPLACARAKRRLPSWPSRPDTRRTRRSSGLFGRHSAARRRPRDTIFKQLAGCKNQLDPRAGLPKEKWRVVSRLTLRGGGSDGI